MTYADLKLKHQEEVNAFPFGFAFSNAQFDEMMKKWNLDPEKDLGKILSFGAGVFIQKKDREAFDKMTARHEQELKDFRKNEKEFIEGLVYQLHNHEYGYSRDVDDMEAALNALGLTWDDVDAQKHPYNHKCLVIAERRCIQEYNEMN